MRLRSGVLAVIAALLSCALAAPAAPAARHKGRTHHHHAHKRHLKKRHRKPHRKHPAAVKSAVRALPVTFDVTNTNSSMAPCSADGKPYTIAGTLFLPATATPTAVTVYVHGLGFDSDFWHFTAVRGYDYASTEATRGHASVLIDRLGYGASSVPAGTASCVGGQASIIHQVISQLRNGGYTSTGQTPVKFTRIGLVGHSAGGELVQIEAYSFHDIDALGVVDWADQLYSTKALSAFGEAGNECIAGGKPEGAGRPTGYGSYGQTAAEYDSLMFHDTDPAVLKAANDARTMDPCGDIESILNGVVSDVLGVGSIDVPVVYVWGTEDANYVSGSPWWQLQEGFYTSSPKVTDVTLENTGHAVTLERSAPQLMDSMDRWLKENQL